MKSKLLVVGSILTFFSGCELLQPVKIPEETALIQKNETFCVWNQSSEANDCNIEFWLKFWYEIDEVSWPDRKKQIDALSDKDTDVLKKIFLSQGKSTPFQSRLRAQGWVESVSPKLSQQMRRFISVALYQPSQDLLEMESALVTLSKINTHQSSNIEDQQILLDKQQSQIDQLLNIETSIMESIEEDKK